MATNSLSPIRPLGLAERYSLTRSLIGTEPVPIYAGMFQLPPSAHSDLLSAHLESSIAALVKAHPILFTTISNSRTNEPQFAWLPSLVTSDLVAELRPSNDDGETGEWGFDEIFEAAMALGLRRGDDVEGRPLWIVRYARLKEQEQDKAAVIFIGHHSLFDGRSAWTVARTLFETLGTLPPDTSAAPSPIDIPQQLLLPSPAPAFYHPLESLVSVAPPKITLLAEIFTSLIRPNLPSFIQSFLPQHSPSPWTGRSTPLLPQTRQQKTIFLSPALMSKVLARCRQEKTTITSFLHAAIALSLLPLSGSLDIKSLTPLDARSIFPPSSTSDAAMSCGTMNGTITSTFSPSQPDKDGVSSFSIWDEARRHTALVRAPNAAADSVREWGMLAYIPSSPAKSSSPAPASNPPTAWESFFLPKLHAPRQSSFEISNVGVLPFSASSTPDKSQSSEEGTNAGEAWKLDQIVFTQPYQELGPALVFSVSTMPALGLTISVSWKKGVLEREEVAGVLARLKENVESHF